MNQTKKQNEDIGVKLICVAKKFQMWQKAYSVYKCKVSVNIESWATSHPFRPLFLSKNILGIFLII
jgi:hypothetical protein